MAKPSTYWDKRAARRLTDAEKQSEAYIKRVNKIYDQAQRNIQRDIDDIYDTYSRKTGVDKQKLKELLTASETDKTWKELKAKGLDKYVKGNYKARITRLEQLQAQIYAKAKEIAPLEQQINTDCYRDILNDSYYKAIYDTQMGTGVDFGFATLDDNLVEAVLSESWSGANYSKRIWGNTDLLADSLAEIVGGALMSGQSIEKTSRQLRDRFGVSKYYADRLIRTESNHFHNEADAMAYEEMGFDKYVFMAVLDTRTSTICQELDNKVIELKDKKVGVNFPPMHPNCRSTTRAYLGEDIEAQLKRRARNPITNENEVIDNMSYGEWHNAKVKKHGKNEVDKAYKKAFLENADKEQYNKYAERLKNSPYLPKNIASFKDLKYNNRELYDQLSREYKTVGRINKKSTNADRDIETYYRFRNDNIEMTDHAIYDYHKRMYKKDGTPNYDYEKMVEVIKKAPNYYDEKTNRLICYYDNICVIMEKDTKEIVSIRKSRLNKKWKKL